MDLFSVCLLRGKSPGLLRGTLRETPGFRILKKMHKKGAEVILDDFLDLPGLRRTTDFVRQSRISGFSIQNGFKLLEN